MEERGEFDLGDWRPVGLGVTLLLLHCPRCRRVWTCPLEGLALRRGRQGVLLPPEGVRAWPTLRCPRCEGAEVQLFEASP